MAWYQTEIKQAQWRKLIQTPNPSILEILNSQQFAIQLLKQGNSEIFSWVQRQYKFFFGELLIRSLILPKQNDNNDRKFKEPSQSIQLLCGVLEYMGVSNSSNAPSLPTSSISNSFSGLKNSMISESLGNSEISLSFEMISFIFNRIFALFFSNNPKHLQSTLIPGYFSRIFECLNRFHSQNLTTICKKKSQQSIFQKLIHTYANFQQIIKCIQFILIVPKTQPTNTTNIQMSVSNSMVQPTSNQANHDWQIKSQLLWRILQKIKNYQMINNFVLLENLVAVVLEIMRNVNFIHEGNWMFEIICKQENCHIFFELAFNQGKLPKIEGLEVQLKSLQILRCTIFMMSQIQRMNLSPYLHQIMRELMETEKATLKTCYVLQLLNEWLLASTNQSPNIQLNTSNSFTSSFNLGGSFSSFGSNSTRISTSFTEIEQLLTQHKIFQHLLKLCLKSPSANIFHTRVLAFFRSAFNSQNPLIINLIYKQNEIIPETTLYAKNFKEDPYFGHYIEIVKTFTSRRINTPIVNEIIQKYSSIWDEFHQSILLPYGAKVYCDLGKLENIPEERPLEYTSARSQYQLKRQEKNKFQNATQNGVVVTEPQIQAFDLPPITLDLSKNQNIEANKQVEISAPKIKQNQEQLAQPISLTFKKKANNVEMGEQKQENQSFQNFMKRKMSQTNRAVEERKKSRTPSKMVSGQSKKKKKWGGDDENTQVIIRKAISADEKIPPKVNEDPQEIITKIKFIKIIQKQNMPNKVRERKMSAVNDAKLMKWIQKSKKNIKSIR